MTGIAVVVASRIQAGAQVCGTNRVQAP